MLTRAIGLVVNHLGHREPVLEMGAGVGSTAYVHWACRALGVPAVTLDNDAGWLNHFTRYVKPFHQHLANPNWQDFRIESPRGFGLDFDNWSVAFIDHAPGERRAVDLMRVANSARIIVVHDTDNMDGYKFEPSFSQFRFRREYQPELKPWTTALSNSIDLNTLDWSYE